MPTSYNIRSSLPKQTDRTTPKTTWDLDIYRATIRALSSMIIINTVTIAHAYTILIACTLLVRKVEEIALG